MLQLIDHDFLLILQAFVLGLFEQAVFGHEKVAMLSLDVQIAILPDWLENSAIWTGQISLSVISGLNLLFLNKKILLISVDAYKSWSKRIFYDGLVYFRCLWVSSVFQALRWRFYSLAGGSFYWFDRIDDAVSSLKEKCSKNYYSRWCFFLPFFTLFNLEFIYRKLSNL